MPYALIQTVVDITRLSPSLSFICIPIYIVTTRFAQTLKVLHTRESKATSCVSNTPSESEREREREKGRN